jgi:hypothetical protein
VKNTIVEVGGATIDFLIDLYVLLRFGRVALGKKEIVEARYIGSTILAFTFVKRFGL